MQPQGDSCGGDLNGVLFFHPTGHLLQSQVGFSLHIAIVTYVCPHILLETLVRHQGHPFRMSPSARLELSVQLVVSYFVYVTGVEKKSHQRCPLPPTN